MEREELDKWWANLTITQKERIAGKIAKKPVTYPACTSYWNELETERKQAVHDHCTGKHGEILKDWTEGSSYSY